MSGAAAPRAACCRATACSCIRVTQEPKGVFASGYVTRASYEVPDSLSKRGYRLCIDFVYDFLVDAHESLW